MIYTLEALVQGRGDILEYYERATSKWKELFDDKKVEAWSDWVTEQEAAYFEKECGGMFIGREVMAWSAFATLYSIQFGWQPETRKLAEKLVKAFAESGCTDDVKEAAKSAEQAYQLDKHKAEPATDQN